MLGITSVGAFFLMYCVITPLLALAVRPIKYFLIDAEIVNPKIKKIKKTKRKS